MLLVSTKLVSVKARGNDDLVRTDHPHIAAAFNLATPRFSATGNPDKFHCLL